MIPLEGIAWGILNEDTDCASEEVKKLSDEELREDPSLGDYTGSNECWYLRKKFEYSSLDNVLSKLASFFK